MKKIILLLLVCTGFVATTPFTAQALDSEKISQNLDSPSVRVASRSEKGLRQQAPNTLIAQYDDRGTDYRYNQYRQRKFSIGPSVELGNGQTIFGIDSKFGISDNLSLRPFVYFPNGGTNFGTALTYDLSLQNSASTLQLTPFVGGTVDFNNTNGNNTTSFGLVGGVDLDLTDSLRLKGAVIVPLNNDRGQTTTVTVGAGFQF